MTVEIRERGTGLATTLGAAASDTSTAASADSGDVMAEVFDDATHGEDIWYKMYYFAGDVSNDLISNFKLGYESFAVYSSDDGWVLDDDFSNLSAGAIENIADGTTPGITPMFAIQDDGSDWEATALFDYSSDGYPYAYGIGTEGSHSAWTLSEEEEEALEEKYTRGSGTLSADLDNLIEDMAEDLLNYFGTLLEPVINFHKTKNKKIIDKQLSALGSEDVTASTTSIDVMSTPTEYEEPEEP
jgi:hypothetical protein